MISASHEQRRLVCIVDDDPGVRKALTRLVESMGLHAVAFASPTDLLEHVPAQGIDCLLLDIQLPGIDGFELRERVEETGRRAPVIFITGHPDDRSRARADEAGAVCYLEKPFDDEDLFDALQNAMQLDSPPRPGLRST